MDRSEAVSEGGRHLMPGWTRAFEIRIHLFARLTGPSVVRALVEARVAASSALALIFPRTSGAER